MNSEDPKADLIARTLAAHPDMSEAGIKESRKHWNDAHPLLRMIRLEAARFIEQSRTELETADSTRVTGLQAKIAATREILAAIEDINPKR